MLSWKHISLTDQHVILMPVQFIRLLLSRVLRAWWLDLSVNMHPHSRVVYLLTVHTQEILFFCSRILPLSWSQGVISKSNHVLYIFQVQLCQNSSQTMVWGTCLDECWLFRVVDSKCWMIEEHCFEVLEIYLLHQSIWIQVICIKKF